jgi:TrkA domain protein
MRSFPFSAAGVAEPRVDRWEPTGETSAVSEIHETALPGVGVRYELTTTAGARLGVVAHRHGRRDLLVYDRGDPDAARESIALSATESAALAALLGSAVTAPPAGEGDTGAVEHIRRGHPVGQFAVDWVPVPPGSPYVGRSIGTAGVRSITGVSIVAVLRQDAAYPAPGPDFCFQAGDTALVVGTPDGVEALVELLED